MGFKTSFALATVPVLFAMAPAHAGTFVFEKSNPNGFGNPNVGQNTYIKSTYNENTEIFTWESTFTRNQTNSNLAEGAWLVVSDGDNPKANNDEYAIFYLDGVNDVVTAYNYDGTNSPNSYQAGTLLGTYALDVSDNGPDERTFKFSLDATDINSNTSFGSDWKGVGFGENIGVWYHGVDPLSVAYNTDGSLANFSVPAQGWYDVSNKTTTEIPEPGSIAALGLFAAAAAGKLRKRIG